MRLIALVLWGFCPPLYAPPFPTPQKIYSTHYPALEQLRTQPTLKNENKLENLTSGIKCVCVCLSVCSCMNAWEI